MDNKEFFLLLEKEKDKKYQEFSSSLSGSDLPLLGVRIPVLKRLILSVEDDGGVDPDAFPLDRYIEISIAYFALSLLRKKNYQEQMEFLLAKLSFARSWQITDTILGFVEKAPFSSFFPYFVKMIDSPDIFTRRFGYVRMRAYSKDKEIKKVLPYIYRTKDYYVEMAEAWLLADIAVYYPELVLSYLQKKKVSLSLAAKAERKLLDSYRILPKDKEEARAILEKKKE